MDTGFPVQSSTSAGHGLVERVLTKYRLPGPIRCHFFNKGLNDTYVVKAGASTYYLRVYRYGWRMRAHIQAELDMLAYLHQHQLPVSRPLQRSDGRYLTRVLAPEGTRYACLFTNAEGSPPTMNDRHSRAYGELVGQIHDCLDERGVDERRFHLDLGHLIDEPLQHIGPFLAHRKKDVDYLKRVGEELKGRIEALLPKTKPLYGNCHGDHHGENLCIDKNGHMTLFDFDCYGYLGFYQFRLPLCPVSP